MACPGGKRAHTVSGHLNWQSYPVVLPLLCRYCNAQQIKALIKASKDWNKWDKYGQKGYKAQKLLARALNLSDTREAILWLEKYRNLTAYAALRGVSPEEIYDKHLFDFGFDENGKRVFNLGNTSIELSLTPDLKLALYDTGRQKAVKSIPKKGIDLAVQKEAEADFADLSQSLKKAVKTKNGQLFREYLSDFMQEAEVWKNRYLANPFLRGIAKLLVWAQDGQSYILTDTGLIDSTGHSYSIGEKPIKIAHPMEMKREEVTAWQKYFTQNSLKQPFQ